MALILQAEQPADYLIASGTTTSLRDFAQAAFAAADLDLADYLESVESLKRPADLSYSAMDPSKILVERCTGRSYIDICAVPELMDEYSIN